MASQASEQRSGFGDFLAELTDSDVVVEVAASDGARRPPEIAQVQRLQDAIQASYRVLAGPAAIEIDTVAVLEEVARRSLSTWLKIRPTAGGGDDEASLLKFLARGTLAIIAWMDGSSTHQLADLQQALRVLAWGTSVTTSAHPVLPSSADLVGAIAAWQAAKTGLGAGYDVRISTNNGSAELDLRQTLDEPRSLLQARKLVNHSADMIFVVEMPDYQATGQWQVKHGDIRTLAYSEPGTLLDKFYRRELDIRPGDALRCRVDFETSYGPDHEVLAERYRIVEVIEVLAATRGAFDKGSLQPPQPVAQETAAELEPAS